MLQPTLENLLEYQCPLAISVFIRKFNISTDRAGEIWKEMLKWLWLGNFYLNDLEASQELHLEITSSLIVLDEMWHCFILCTEKYDEFCRMYFGKFLHHYPLDCKRSGVRLI